MNIQQNSKQYSLQYLIQNMKGNNSISPRQSLSLQDSPDYSIIARMPLPQDSPEPQQYTVDVERLQAQISYYKTQAMRIDRNPLMQSVGSSQQITRNSSIPLEQQSIVQQLTTDNAQLSHQIREQRKVIERLSSDLRQQKTKDRKVEGGQKLLSQQCQHLQLQNDRYRDENIRQTKQLKQLQYKIADMELNNKRHEDTIQMQRRQLKEKYEDRPEEARLQNLELEYKIAQLQAQVSDNLKEIDSLNDQIDKLKKQNVIDRQSRNKLRVGQGSRSRFSMVSHSRISDLQQLDHERISMKLSEKNRQYELLYSKYQSLQNEYVNLQESYQQLLIQQKILEQRIRDFEVHTEGDELNGELQNKLVLMSTEVMRLGSLSRQKVSENKQLTMKIRQLLLKNQHLQKDLIEKDKSIVNYRQQLRLMEIRLNEMLVSQQKARDDSDFRDKNNKFSRQIQRITKLYREKLQALKNADIRNAIMEEKNIRLTKQYEQLQKENKVLSQNQLRRKEDSTKMLNQQAQIGYFQQAHQVMRQQIKNVQFRLSQTRSHLQQVSRQRDQHRRCEKQLREKLNKTQQELKRIVFKVQEKQCHIRQIEHFNQQKDISHRQQIKKLEETIHALQKENQRMGKFKSEIPKIEQLIKDIQQLQRSQLSLKLLISNYEERLSLLAQQNQRLRILNQTQLEQKGGFEKIKLQLEQKDKKIIQLKRQAQSLQNKQRKSRQNCQDLRLKLRACIIQEINMKNLEFKNRQLNDQIDALATRLSVKEEQLSNLTKRYQKQCIEKASLVRINEQLNIKVSSSSTLFSNGISNNSHFQRQVRDFEKKRKRQDLRIQQLEKQVQEHEQIYATFSGQIMRLNQVIGETVEQNRLLKRQAQLLQHKVKTCQQALQLRKQHQISSQKSIMETQNKSKIDVYEGKLKSIEGEIQMLKGRNHRLKQINKQLQLKVSKLNTDNGLLEVKVNELQYQLSAKSQSFRSVEDNLRLTILQIRNSNQRLQQSLSQIQHHYITKLQSKETQYQILLKKNKQYQNQINDLEKKLTTTQASFNSQLMEKNYYINTLNSNLNTKITKQQAELTKKISQQNEIQVALLSQQIDKLKNIKADQDYKIEQLYREAKQNESRYIGSMKESTHSIRIIQTLSQQIERLNQIIFENTEKVRLKEKRNRQLQNLNSILRQQAQQRIGQAQRNQNFAHQQRNTFLKKIQHLQNVHRKTQQQLQEKKLQCERLIIKIKSENEEQRNHNDELIEKMLDQLRLLREGNQSLGAGNQNLQEKLGKMTKQYEQLVQQLQLQRKSRKKNNEDQRLRIINNYEVTIRHLKQELSRENTDKSNMLLQAERSNQYLREMQQRKNIAEQKARTYEEKSKRLQQRLRIIEDRLKNQDETLKLRGNEKTAVEQKISDLTDEVCRLKNILKNKQDQIDRLLVQNKKQQILYYSQQKMVEQNGIFVIREASEKEERSRSASGNHPNQPKSSAIGVGMELQYRYELMEASNKKLTNENQCLRKKCIQFEFKMNKLKEEFELINRLIHEYREENDKLKQTNRLLSTQIGIGNNVHSRISSPQHSTLRAHSQLEVHRHNISIGSMGQRSRLRMGDEIE